MHGAITESRHVFIKSGLEFIRKKRTSGETIKVFEVGFGTALNAVLSYEWASKHQVPLVYESIEAFPLPEDVLSNLNYFGEEELLAEVLKKLHLAEWDKRIAFGSNFYLHKVKGSLDQYHFEKDSIDIIFYDAFAPSKQPEMWEKSILEKAINGLIPGGVFVTYCAKGQLKRDLKELGCEVETLAGPPGKKEMVRATKIHTLW